MGTGSSSQDIDCISLSSAELMTALRAQEAGGEYRLLNVASQASSVGSGPVADASYTVDADLGDYCFALAQNAHWMVNGNVGRACGHSLVAAEVLIKGNAGACVGAFATGGFLAVLGKAGANAGYGLSGGEIVVRSSCGDDAARCMRSGVLVLSNGTGERLGRDMTGGIIFLRGKAASVDSHARMVRMKDADALRLSLLLARAGINGNVKEFKMYRARKSA